jgi:hypothetical protein
MGKKNLLGGVGYNGIGEGGDFAIVMLGFCLCDCLLGYMFVDFEVFHVMKELWVWEFPMLKFEMHSVIS